MGVFIFMISHEESFLSASAGTVKPWDECTNNWSADL